MIRSAPGSSRGRLAYRDVGGARELPPASEFREPFSVTAEVYDIVYHGLPFGEQADRIVELVRTHNPSA